MTDLEVIDYLKERGVVFELCGPLIRAKETRLCPVCEACRLAIGRVFLNMDYIKAASLLSLPSKAAMCLVDAADDCTAQKPYLESLRKLLLELVHDAK